MKAFRLIAIAMVLLTSSLKAQVSVNVNIGSPPLWGPVGYTEERYYYLPDVEAYYDVQTSMFIYYGGGVWVHRSYLPGRYRNYDLYNGYKVVMTDYRGNTPYTTFNTYKVKYRRGYHGGAQRTIGVRPGKGNSGQKRYAEDRSHNRGHKINAKRQNTVRESSQGNMNRAIKPQSQGNGNGHGKKR